jgi:hypothetical protein
VHVRIATYDSTNSRIYSDNCTAQNGGTYLCDGFSLAAALDVTGAVSIANVAGGIQVKAKLTSMSANWTLVESNVGTVQTSMIQTFTGENFDMLKPNANCYRCTDSYCVGNNQSSVG